MGDMLFISRLQTGHKGHLSAMQQGIEQWAKRILLGIGSANKERTPDNPLTLQERMKVADVMVNLLKTDYPDVDVEIHSIPDFGDGVLWKNYIDTTLPSFDMIVSGNETVSKMRTDKKVVIPQMRVPYKWTHIRYQLARENRTILQESVPNQLLDVLKNDIKAHEIIQSIEKLQPQTPKIATDLIIIYNNKYVLGRRKYAPYGLALLGWMMESGEKWSDCALREWYEELFHPDDPNKQLSILNKEPLFVLDDPWRDPRWHIISFVYEIQILAGNPIGADDIEEWLVFLSPGEIDTTSEEEFAFPDHRTTLLRHRDML